MTKGRPPPPTRARLARILFAANSRSTADALIHKCNSIWDTMQRRLASAENEGGAPAAESGQSSDASASTDNADVSSNPAFDLVFFKGSIKAVNMLSGLGVCWSDENAAAGAARAVAFFQGGQVRGRYPSDVAAVWYALLTAPRPSADASAVFANVFCVAFTFVCVGTTWTGLVRSLERDRLAVEGCSSMICSVTQQYLLPM